MLKLLVKLTNDYLFSDNENLLVQYQVHQKKFVNYLFDLSIIQLPVPFNLPKRRGVFVSDCTYEKLFSYFIVA